MTRVLRFPVSYITICSSSYAWFNFTCYHPPPGQPRGQVQPFRPGGGELFEAVLSRGEGGGANKKVITSCSSCKVRHFSVDTMAPDRAEKTAYFRGKSLEFVADWLKKNKLSKLKSVFEGTFIIINC